MLYKNNMSNTENSITQHQKFAKRRKGLWLSILMRWKFYTTFTIRQPLDGAIFAVTASCFCKWTWKYQYYTVMQYLHIYSTVCHHYAKAASCIMYKPLLRRAAGHESTIPAHLQHCN